MTEGDVVKAIKIELRKHGVETLKHSPVTKMAKRFHAGANILTVLNGENLMVASVRVSGNVTVVDERCKYDILGGDDQSGVTTVELGDPDMLSKVVTAVQAIVQ